MRFQILGIIIHIQIGVYNALLQDSLLAIRSEAFRQRMAGLFFANHHLSRSPLDTY